eukprot:4554302-Prymnesium_polylepis.1
MMRVPAPFAVVAAEIAVLSSPPIVCTPSDRSTITLGTPERAPVPAITACPPSMPPERKVFEQYGGAVSSALVMVDRVAVRGNTVTTLPQNST